MAVGKEIEHEGLAAADDAIFSCILFDPASDFEIVLPTVRVSAVFCQGVYLLQVGIKKKAHYGFQGDDLKGQAQPLILGVVRPFFFSPPLDFHHDQYPKSHR